MTVTVGRLWHHPVKSMRGEMVDEVVLGPGGLIGDRAYGFVDLETERLVSAKHPKRYGALLNCQASFTRPPRVDEPTPPVRVSFPDGSVIDGSTEDGPELIARQVSALLGREVRMVTGVAPGVTYEEVWPELAGFGPADFYGAMQVNRAEDDEAGERILAVPAGMAAPDTLLDLAALHVMAASTLSSLAQLHPLGKWDDRRFRPNILFDDEGAEPASAGGLDGRYAEDSWIGCDLRIGHQVRVHVVAPTLRCPMPTLAQGELPRDGDILRTLVRESSRQLGELGKFPCAGAYAEVVTPGVVRTGDPVEITATVATESALASAVEMIGAGLRAARG